TWPVVDWPAAARLGTRVGAWAGAARLASPGAPRSIVASATAPIATAAANAAARSTHFRVVLAPPRGAVVASAVGASDEPIGAPCEPAATPVGATVGEAAAMEADSAAEPEAAATPGGAVEPERVAAPGVCTVELAGTADGEV